MVSSSGLNVDKNKCIRKVPDHYIFRKILSWALIHTGGFIIDGEMMNDLQNVIDKRKSNHVLLHETLGADHLQLFKYLQNLDVKLDELKNRIEKKEQKDESENTDSKINLRLDTQTSLN